MPAFLVSPAHADAVADGTIRQAILAHRPKRPKATGTAHVRAVVGGPEVGAFPIERVDDFGIDVHGRITLSAGDDPSTIRQLSDIDADTFAQACGEADAAALAGVLRERNDGELPFLGHVVYWDPTPTAVDEAPADETPEG